MAEKKIATRESYGNALAELGEKYDIVVLDADLSKSTKTEVFKKKFPDRFINMGIAEQNMMSTAAGLASCGKIVFASSFAMFAAGRAFEQIRNSIAYPNLNVKIGATHAGISVGEDGATHQCLEDIGIMRTIPNMVIINPADDVEARAAVKAAADDNGPVYLRFGRLGVPVIYGDDYKFELGKGVTLKDGSDVTIFATGLMVEASLSAAEALSEQGISARVVNIHTIKPIDREIIVNAARETGAVVTCEEHNIVARARQCGCGQVLCEEHPVPMVQVGVKDCFGKSGVPAQPLKDYGTHSRGRCRGGKESNGKEK